jgi:hypothetical protein
MAFTRVGDGVTAKPIFCTTEEDGTNLIILLPVTAETMERECRNFHEGLIFAVFCCCQKMFKLKYTKP